VLSALGGVLIYFLHGFVEDIRADSEKVKENVTRISVLETNLTTMKTDISEIKQNTKDIWEHLNGK
jgi:Tfp pilus assembly protein PilN